MWRLAMGAALATALAACSEDEAVPACTAETNCALGQLCHKGECVDPARLRCVPGGEEKAALKLSDAELEFGPVASTTVTKALTVTNEGSCTLAIVSAKIEGGAAGRFVCGDCDERRLPVYIYPGRAFDWKINALPGAPVDLEDALLLESSDTANARLRIPLHARSLGEPALTVSPRDMNFGFVRPGLRAERKLTVVNSGSGTAELVVTEIVLEPPDTTAFSFSPAFAATSLAPASASASSGIVRTIAYHPTTIAAHSARLVVKAQGQDPVVVTLRGSEVPPDIKVAPMMIDFGKIRVGRSTGAVISVQNTGTADLLLSARFVSALSADLQMPRGLPNKIGPGDLETLPVTFAPTAGGVVRDTVVIESNDPDQPIVMVPITGEGDPMGREVATIELRFSNQSNSLLDRDLRDVDLILESPVGRICREDMPMPNWGGEGMPRWSAAPPAKNPERIVLADVMQDGTYNVQLSYVEDCASLPTALAATLLGIGTDELIDYLSEGMVSVDRERVANVIEQTCFSRQSVSGTVVLKITNQPIVQIPMSMGAKGEFREIVKLKNTNGRFTVIR